MLLVGDFADLFDFKGIVKVVIYEIDNLHPENPPVEVYNRPPFYFINNCPSQFMFEQVERLVVRHGVLNLWYRGC